MTTVPFLELALIVAHGPRSALQVPGASSVNSKSVAAPGPSTRVASRQAASGPPLGGQVALAGTAAKANNTRAAVHVHLVAARRIPALLLRDDAPMPHGAHRATGVIGDDAPPPCVGQLLAGRNSSLARARTSLPYSL